MPDVGLSETRTKEKNKKMVGDITTWPRPEHLISRGWREFDALLSMRQTGSTSGLNALIWSTSELRNSVRFGRRHRHGGGSGKSGVLSRRKTSLSWGYISNLAQPPWFEAGSSRFKNRSEITSGYLSGPHQLNPGVEAIESTSIFKSSAAVSAPSPPLLVRSRDEDNSWTRVENWESCCLMIWINPAHN